MQIHGKTPLERLLIKSKRVIETGCLEWQGSRFINRGKPTYGQMWYKGTNRKSHNVSWIEQKGPIPKGRMVCHSCDNMVCVEIDHLFLGDALINNRDCIAKGRKAIFLGERNGTSKLTEAQAREIKNSKLTEAVLAAQFKISRGTVHDIKSGFKWKWVK